jgi:hypothetical protein
MQIRGSLTKGVLIALSVALIPVAAVSAQKITPGSTCKVLNQKVVYQNKTFTCIKSGKKLIWNKGAVIKVAAKPTPTQSAVPISLNRREKALAEVKRVYDLNSSYQPTVKYIFASDAPQNFAELIKEVIPFASRFWSSEFKPTAEFPIILGSPASVEWVNDEMKRYGHEIPGWNREFISKLGENASRGDVVNNSRGTITYYVIGKEKDRSIKAGNELTMRGFVAHEYVHAVAVSIVGDRQKGIPGWAVEGSANFYGFAIAALMAEQPVVAMNRVNVGNLRRSYSEQGALIPHSLNKDDLYKAVVTSEKGGGGEGTTCAEPKILCYTAGALFTEVLVADYGHGKFVDWWKLSRKKNWEVAFEEVYGIQIDKWYEEVAIPYVIEESKSAIPEVSAPKSASTFTQHSARPPRPFVDPSNQNQQPTPTPTKQPISLNYYEKFKETGSKGLKMFDEWRSNPASGKPESKIEYWFGSSVPQEIVTGSKRKLDNAVLQWERFHKVSRTKIYLDLAMKDQITEKCQVMAPRSASFTIDWCRSQAEQGIRDFIYQAAAYESEGSWRPILAPRLSPAASVTHSYVLLQPSIFLTDSFFPRIEHEWFHQIQFDLSGNHYIRENPVWFMEGAAEYFGLLMAAMDEPEYFVRHRAQSWFPGGGDNRNTKMTKDAFSAWISKNTVPRLTYNDWSDNLPTDGTPYKYGAVLTEWLVGKIGFKGMVDLLRDIETLGWKKSFEKQLGKPQESFLDEMADYLYAEYQIAEQNSSWLSMPRCKNLDATRFLPEPNKGVCFSG